MKTSIIKGLILLVLAAGFYITTSGGMAQPKPDDAEPPPEKTGPLTLDQVIEKLQKNYDRIETYKAKFDQEIFSMKQGRVVSEGKGEVLYKKPGKMVWHYTDPEEHLYINEGNTIWDYSPAQKEAYRLPVQESVYKSFLLGLSELREDFEISFHSGTRKNSKGQYQLDLVARDKQERQVLGTLTLYVDPETFMVKSSESVDALGNTNHVVFKDIKLNEKIEDKKFKFSPPDGVKVIDSEISGGS